MELYYTSIPTSLKTLMELNKLKGKRTVNEEDTTESQEVLSEEEEEVSLAYVVEENNEYRKVVAKNIILADIHAKHRSTRRVYGNRKCSVNYCTQCETEKQMRIVEDASSLTYYYSGVPDVNPTVTCSSSCSERDTSIVSSSSTSSPCQVLPSCGSYSSLEQFTSDVTSSSSSSPELVTSSVCDTSLEELTTIGHDSNSSVGENISDSVEGLECPELETVSGIWHEAPKELQKTECWDDDDESCHSPTDDPKELQKTECWDDDDESCHSPTDDPKELQKTECWDDDDESCHSPTDDPKELQKTECSDDEASQHSVMPSPVDNLPGSEEDWGKETNASCSPPLRTDDESCDLITPSVEASKIPSLEEDWEEEKIVSSSSPTACTERCRQFFLSDMSAEEILAHLNL